MSLRLGAGLVATGALICSLAAAAPVSLTLWNGWHVSLFAPAVLLAGVPLVVAGLIVMAGVRR